MCIFLFLIYIVRCGHSRGAETILLCMFFSVQEFQLPIAVNILSVCTDVCTYVILF